MKKTKQEVYVIGHPNGYVKIGRSKNSRKRLSTLNVGSPYKLELIASIEFVNSISVERFIHKLFSVYYVKGEWYQYHDNMVEILRHNDFSYFAILLSQWFSSEKNKPICTKGNELEIAINKIKQMNDIGRLKAVCTIRNPETIKALRANKFRVVDSLSKNEYWVYWNKLILT